MTKSTFYIPNLNGLRFIAVFAVILGHLEMTKRELGIEHLLGGSNDFFSKGGGHFGVVLFFVLSGFLITLLLLKEKDKTGDVRYRKFLIRRALRIWPVYFLFISVVIFGVHGIDFILTEKKNGGLLIGLYYFILPNLAMSGFGSIAHIAHLWSIGVEEQFYLIWPLILKFFSKKLVVFTLVFLCLIIPVIPHLADFLAVRFPVYEFPLMVIRLFFQYFLINAMAIGGLFAFLFYKYEELLREKLNLLTTTIVVFTSFGLWFSGTTFGGVTDVVYMILFGLLILATSLSNPLFVFENKFISYLGKVSYGLYVYHWITAFFVLKGLIWLELEDQYLLSLITTLILTIFIAALSYEFLEKNVLKLKDKYTIVKSGAL